MSIRPSLGYRGFFTDNLFHYQQVTSQSDFVHYVSPEVLLERAFNPGVWEVSLSVGYVPTFVVQTSHSEYDRTYHLVRGGVDAVRDEQRVSLSHTYSLSSELTYEVGLLAPQERNETQLTYSQPLGGRLSVSASADQSLTDTASGSFASIRSLRSWGGNGFLIYAWLPKVSTGLGGGVSYQTQTGQYGDYSAMYEQVLTRWGYQASGKVDVTLDVGMQVGQFLTRGVSDPSPTPVLNGTVQYAPRYGTGLSLSAARTAGLSAIQSGQSSIENRVSLGAHQRVYESMVASITAGYGQGSFEGTSLIPGVPTRHYDNYTVGLDYAWIVNEHLRVSLFYQYMRRFSDLDRDTYSNNQVGLTARYAL